MIDTIPATLVAESLGVARETLPPGDLPVERMATRFLDFLRASLSEEAGSDHPEFWSFALYGALVADHPATALAVMRAASAQLRETAEGELLAGGPLSELLNAKGAEALLPALQEGAAQSPRFAWLLAGTEAEGSSNTPFWQQIQLLGAQAPDTDDLPSE